MGRRQVPDSHCALGWFYNLTQAIITWVEGTLTEKMLPLGWPVGWSVEHFCLVVDMGWGGKPTVDSAIPRQAVLGWVKKHAEQAMGSSRQCSPMACASAPA